MKAGVKNFIKLFVFLLIVVGILIYLNDVFFYRDKSVWSTDHRVEEYQKLPEDSLDVLFVGSSNVMSSINPVQLWRETGIQSYALCSRAQTFPFAYAYLKDALKTQNPQCVVLDAYSVFSEKSTNGLANGDFHLGVNMDSLSIEAKAELVTKYIPKSEWPAYYFPLFKNHNYYKTWENPEDETGEIFMGYCFADGAEYFETPVYSEERTALEEVDGIYLQKIIELCQAEGIDLYVIKTPVVYSDAEHQELNAVKQMCEAYGVMYYDMSMDATQWGFDFGTDMLNYFHNNTSGAAKVTTRLGDILAASYDFSDSKTHQHAAVWEAEYQRMVEFRTQ
ncbi:MAG: hypothetical protein IJZ23_09025 [Roseburia sp.]|nr:hypothetical protein [Roseburia sp.]